MGETSSQSMMVLQSAVVCVGLGIQPSLKTAGRQAQMPSLGDLAK